MKEHDKNNMKHQRFKWTSQPVGHITISSCWLAQHHNTPRHHNLTPIQVQKHWGVYLSIGVKLWRGEDCIFNQRAKGGASGDVCALTCLSLPLQDWETTPTCQHLQPSTTRPGHCCQRHTSSYTLCYTPKQHTGSTERHWQPSFHTHIQHMHKHGWHHLGSLLFMKSGWSLSNFTSPPVHLYSNCLGLKMLRRISTRRHWFAENNSQVNSKADFALRPDDFLPKSG